jgi:hypothetical protein
LNGGGGSRAVWSSLIQAKMAHAKHWDAVAINIAMHQVSQGVKLIWVAHGAYAHNFLGYKFWARSYFDLNGCEA